MNFLPLGAFPRSLRRTFAMDGDPDVIGFRPESAQLTAPSPQLLVGKVDSQRILGTAQGRVVSIYGLRCGKEQVFVRSPASFACGDEVGIALDHSVGFREALRVGGDGPE